MYLLHGDNWEDCIMDYHRPPGQLRIAVTAWAVVRPIKGMYLVRPRNWGMLREYLVEFGLRAVIRKVRSRLNESLRNEKFVSVGMGRILSTDDNEQFPENAPVIFLAPAHPRCVERIVLSPELVRGFPDQTGELNRDPGGVRFYESAPDLPSLNGLIGWQSESGIPLPPKSMGEIFSAVADYWDRLPAATRILPLSSPSVVATHAPLPEPENKRLGLNAVLYGLGNYAKTQILPSLDPAIRVTTIHELDPTQVSKNYRKNYSVSTDPAGEEDSKFDIHLIAGYHHTHADLAIRALFHGAVAVVEKPVITNHRQLVDLLDALQRSGGRLYSCFQMRYNPLFLLARRDLALTAGDPVHITADVYEIPLPPYHWYRWPSSGSHLISNGCHWLDHFLFMNDFSRPINHTVSRLSNGDTVATVELANGACLSLHLTHIGSPRIGVQETVTMRKGDRTVTVVNSSRYLAEAGPRKIRVKKLNKMDVYRRMYREISRKILQGEEGDSLESIEVSGSLMLDIEDDLQRHICSQND